MFGLVTIPIGVTGVRPYTEQMLSLGHSRGLDIYKTSGGFSMNVVLGKCHHL